MLPRILDISDSPARLSVRNRLLVVARGDEPPVTIPLAELAVVVVAHPQVTLTQAALAELSAQGGCLVVCDERRLPAGMLLPLVGHHVQTERLAAQAAAPQPLKKRLWQQVVRSKIRAQAEVLSELRGGDGGLAALVPLVRSGDPANVEARAARRYWTTLFPGSDFRRDRDGQDQNRLLNYGYAVLRAIVARAAAAAGLHPSLGLHHRNRYNPFCLADDLMEPFRPVVDRAVARWVDAHGADRDLDGDTRRMILASLFERHALDGEQHTLFEVTARLAASLAQAYAGQTRRLAFPSGLAEPAPPSRPARRARRSPSPRQAPLPLVDPGPFVASPEGLTDAQK